MSIGIFIAYFIHLLYLPIVVAMPNFPKVAVAATSLKQLTAFIIYTGL